MRLVMTSIGLFGALALGWYAGHEPLSPLAIEWRLPMVIASTVAIFASLLSTQDVPR